MNEPSPSPDREMQGTTDADRVPGRRRVFFVSDSTGITAGTLGNALLSQFEHVDFIMVTIPFITDASQAVSAVGRIDAAAKEDAQRPIVFSTLADSKLHEIIARSRALVFDLFRTFIGALEQELHSDPSRAAGRFHTVSNRAYYEGRIGAVEFALAHDDGAGVRSYHEAQIILIGVSRSGKTPTSVYLAMQFGIKAANYPLTEEILSTGADLPSFLLDHRSRLFGLTIHPERLSGIRTERRPNTIYASFARCRSEVREAQALYERHRIPFLDTSAASVEEIASKAMKCMGLGHHA
ncbi:posphoenolpyruvate synthetase regulatory kinase/phosphorylase PpsR [Thioalkalivibrio sp. HK1]|uniref:posphoenolpyruvate synthetase regulatory kinase/phosphorylase PpsR n=1 Tax=Thioalkalivibrio sp. HK1 TaxID=1469245 RepID=UPI000471E190|nr:pyruvate, water dikinase regulatory protein [Thioalkalivibrio sp. HK1]